MSKSLTRLATATCFVIPPPFHVQLFIRTFTLDIKYSCPSPPPHSLFVHEYFVSNFRDLTLALHHWTTSLTSPPPFIFISFFPPTPPPSLLTVSFIGRPNENFNAIYWPLSQLRGNVQAKTSNQWFSSFNCLIWSFGEIENQNKMSEKHFDLIFSLEMLFHYFGNGNAAFSLQK